MTVKIHGKEYKTVAERITEFRANEKTKNYSIVTDLISIDEDGRVIVKASISGPMPLGIIATGYAEEVRDSTNINKTSALENCETSAIGRALASFGLSGTEYASAEEVANAIAQQKEMEAVERLISHNTAVTNNLLSIIAIKEGIGAEEYSSAAEAWFELDEDTKRALWVAPTKGGIFTTQERDIMSSKEFRESHFGVNENE